MSKKTKAVQQQKLIIGGLLGVIVIGIAAAFFLAGGPAGTDGYVENEHYKVLTEQRRIRGDKIEVMEFFSYACIHCYNLDDDLTEWAEERADTVKLVRNPVMANPLWRLYGQAYFTMEDMGLLEDGHENMFKIIHDARRVLNTPEEIAEALAPADQRAAFIAKFNSPEIQRKTDQADELARRFRIASVPGLVVQGKYHVQAGNGIGLTQMMDVADFLIAKESGDPDAN